MNEEILAVVRGGAGCLTLNRPKALNALSLGMVRALTQQLLAWRDDPAIRLVAIRGQGKEGPFGAFCAGGDIRFFHQAALAGNPQLEDFFTEEYALNHLIHHYPKPYVVFMDGICMGGGMGLSGHGAGNSVRIVTERSKLAMPETNIGLFPDVGGGWFLARCCPGAFGVYLALTGEVIDGDAALTAGLADVKVASSELPRLWDELAQGGLPPTPSGGGLGWGRSRADDAATIDTCFSHPTIPAILAALESDGSDFARTTLATLRKRSPLMLHVVLEQVRRARTMTLADELRMERDMVRRAFHLRPGAASETVEGIRALAVDKDHAPNWNPAHVEDVRAEDVAAFFEPPWPAHAHPLRGLAD